MAPVDRDRGGIDHMAFDPVLLEQTVDPEAIEAGLLDDHDLNRLTDASLGGNPQAHEQGEQGGAVATSDDMGRPLVVAGRIRGDQPLRLTQLSAANSLLAFGWAGFIPVMGRRALAVMGRLHVHVWQPRSRRSGRRPPA
jgi:hypothetical protein